MRTLRSFQQVWNRDTCACVRSNLPGAQRDNTDVFPEGTLLNLVHELGQLGVSAAAVVNLTTQTLGVTAWCKTW